MFMEMNTSEFVKHPQVIFYFPFKHPSGVSNLFIRLAQWLNEKCKICVSIIDYADGYMAKQIINDGKIILIPFTEKRKISIQEDSIFVMQSLLPYTLPQNIVIDPQTRIIQWHFLYHALINSIIPVAPLRYFQYRNPKVYHVCMSLFFPKLKKSLEIFIKEMVVGKSLIFQDKQVMSDTLDYLLFSVEKPIFVSVPVIISELSRRLEIQPGLIRCGWVGRLYDFKIHILMHTIIRLSKWSKDHKTKVEFRIVGDGDESWRLGSLDIGNEYFSLFIVDTIPNNYLSKYMLENFDIAFSMGTAALESAAIGIPTVLLDYSLEEIKLPYTFKWLFNTNPGDIGHKISLKDNEQKEDSLGKLLDELNIDLHGVSTKCYDYCIKYHSIDVIGNQFIKVLDSCSYCWHDIPKRLKKVSLPRKLRAKLRTLGK